MKSTLVFHWSNTEALKEMLDAEAGWTET
jgi:hypothetical protein